MSAVAGIGATEEALDTAGLGQVVLAGHSSRTQVAAQAATLRPGTVAALVLASPTIDPKARSWIRLLAYWRAGRPLPDPGPDRLPQAGVAPRRLARRRLAPAHQRRAGSSPRPPGRHRSPLSMPVLVLRGRDDRLLSPQWARHLASLAPHGRLEILPGPHTFPWVTFPWVTPAGWSPLIRALAGQAAAG
jgi:pimeloyl-ACP methyl ester carboxylesterase